MNVQTSEETAPSGSGEGRRSGNPSVRRWRPSDGQIGSVLSVGAIIEQGRNGYPPLFEVAAVSTDECDWVLFGDDLQAFWNVHAEATVHLVDAGAFIVAVERASGFDFTPMMDEGRVIDLFHASDLRQLAMKGRVARRICSLRRLLEAEEPGSAELESGGSVGGPLTSDLTDGGAVRVEAAIVEARAIRRLGKTVLSKLRAIARSHGSSDPLLGQRHWVATAWALQRVGCWGIGTDGDRLAPRQTALISEANRSLAVLKRAGYHPHKPAWKATLQSFRTLALKKRDGHLHLLPLDWRTSGGRPDHKRRAATSCVDEALRYDFFARITLWEKGVFDAWKSRLHPTYRLSPCGWPQSADPDIQTLIPRYALYECCVPSDRNIFLVVDFSNLHLSRLAQYCTRHHGRDSVPKCFWSGEDVLLRIAAAALRKPVEKVTWLERQKAAIIAYGVPRDMRKRALARCAAEEYGVPISENEAGRFARAFRQLFPKVDGFLKANGFVDALRNRFDLSDSPRGRKNAAHLLVRVLGGHSETNLGRRFGVEETDWAWSKAVEIANALGRPDLLPGIAARKGSADLLRQLRPPPTVVLESGRVYGGLTFCQSRRLFMDAAYADAVGRALYGLVRDKVRVCAVLRDHFVIELCRDYASAQEVERVATIILENINKVFPWTPVRLDCRVAERWHSPVSGPDFSYDDAEGGEPERVFSFVSYRTGCVRKVDSDGCHAPLTRHAAAVT